MFSRGDSGESGPMGDRATLIGGLGLPAFGGQRKGAGAQPVAERISAADTLESQKSGGVGSRKPESGCWNTYALVFAVRLEEGAVIARLALGEPIHESKLAEVPGPGFDGFGEDSGFGPFPVAKLPLGGGHLIEKTDTWPPSKHQEWVVYRQSPLSAVRNTCWNTWDATPIAGGGWRWPRDTAVRQVSIVSCRNRHCPK